MKQRLYNSHQFLTIAMQRVGKRTALENKMELPSHVPDGIRIIKGNYGNGRIHYGTFCCQSKIPKGKRFGPYCGKIIQPSEVEAHKDNAYLWEVCHPTGNIEIKVCCCTEDPVLVAGSVKITAKLLTHKSNI